MRFFKWLGIFVMMAAVGVLMWFRFYDLDLTSVRFLVSYWLLYVWFGVTFLCGAGLYLIGERKE